MDVVKWMLMASIHPDNKEGGCGYLSGDHVSGVLVQSVAVRACIYFTSACLHVVTSMFSN